MHIVGAGLAGLIAAHAFPQARLFEAQSSPRAAHKALLRFRSCAVAQLTGTEFKEVTVRKGIWFNEAFAEPNIQLANSYSRKVTGTLIGDRSIWSLEPVQRFIAPEDFYDQLVEAVGARVHWNVAYDYTNADIPIISTAPLPHVLNRVRIPAPEGIFRRAPIHVARYRVPGADVYQTIYYPGSETSIYRASITGSLLIVESIEAVDTPEVAFAAKAFGIHVGELQLLEKVDQHFGKIVPLPTELRRNLLHKLTAERGIFSLGRFATWRNILLDDVVKDIHVLRRLIKSSGYERSMFAAGAN